MIGNNSGISSVISDVKTITTSDHVGSLVYEGKAFTFSEYMNLAAAQVVDYLIDPTAWIAPAGYHDIIEFAVPSVYAESGPITLDFYSAPVVTGNGTEQQAFNRNSKSAIEAQTKLYKGPTLSSPGTKFSGILIPASASGPGSTPFSLESSENFIINPANKILVRLTNQNGAGTDLTFRINFLEY